MHNYSKIDSKQSFPTRKAIKLPQAILLHIKTHQEGTSEIHFVVPVPLKFITISACIRLVVCALVEMQHYVVALLTIGDPLRLIAGTQT
jgi:hypothetical protein